MNAWLKKCAFNLDLNRESVSEPRTLSAEVERVQKYSTQVKVPLHY